MRALFWLADHYILVACSQGREWKLWCLFLFLWGHHSYHEDPTLMLLLLLSRFSCVQLCVTPQTAVHQDPPSLGFSRQEYWSGLPFPSPMHESEKWKWSHSVVSDSSPPHGLQPTRLLCPWDFPGKSTGVGCHFLLQCMKVTSESEVAQSCPTLSEPMDHSPPGSSIHGIFQARRLS